MMAGMVTGPYAGLAMVEMLPPEMEWSGHDGRAGHRSLCWTCNGGHASSRDGIEWA